MCSIAIVPRPFVVRQRSGIARLGILPSLVIPDIPSLIVTALVVLRVLSPVIVLNLSLMISLMAPHISTLDSSSSHLPSGDSIAASFPEVVESASELLIMFTEAVSEFQDMTEMVITLVCLSSYYVSLTPFPS